jgi:uncharacterized protein (DUF58 family)
VVLAVDLSASLWHGSGPGSKKETLLRLCAVLGFAALQHQDRVGLFLFTDRVERYLPPRRGKAATFRALQELIGFEPAGKKTDYRPAFRMLSKVLKRRSILFLISDFTESIPLDTASVLARRHDLVAAVLRDPLEKQARLPARVAVRDPETGRVGFLSPGSTAAFKKAEDFRIRQLQALVSKGADLLEITAGDNIVSALLKFFRRRIERMGRR